MFVYVFVFVFVFVFEYWSIGVNYRDLGPTFYFPLLAMLLLCLIDCCYCVTSNVYLCLHVYSYVLQCWYVLLLILFILHHVLICVISCLCLC